MIPKEYRGHDKEKDVRRPLARNPRSPGEARRVRESPDPELGEQSAGDRARSRGAPAASSAEGRGGALSRDGQASSRTWRTGRPKAPHRSGARGNPEGTPVQ